MLLLSSCLIVMREEVELVMSQQDEEVKTVFENSFYFEQWKSSLHFVINALLAVEIMRNKYLDKRFFEGIIFCFERITHRY